VRPGLSGWAQVCGGKLINIDEKAALDEWYIRHASLWRDLSIVVRTTGMLLLTGDRRDEKAITAAVRERLATPAAAPQAANGAEKEKCDLAVASQPTLKEIAGSLTT